ncbi:MAG: Indolepyruvate ferredoxin oxidoreductase, alpha and beta subunit [Micavibrio sp.]|nr:Indolepyruvate ferredoxin oxidoreductase, alpha and beta subunit [Micavibrio sp.]
MAPAQLRKVSLKDKYELTEGVAYMSGLQALTRIPVVQRERDIAAGLNTAGFISGYRGSPLGGYDRELIRASKYLDALNVKFIPGVNEDLAATAVWGTQQVGLLPGAKVDGVFGIWYGKAPGVDRSGDVMRHANATGTAPKGGVLAIFGDDHGCKSSTLPCQSDHALYAMQIPQLYPASIQEFVEYGLLGIAMSRYSGCWSAMKVTSETVETSGTIDLVRENRSILIPGDDEFEMPPGGLHIRLNDQPRDVDFRLQNYKLFAAHAFARKNKIDQVIWDSPKPRFGIITSGKSYGDVRQALADLGITEQVARDIGLRLYKVGMTWPLEPQGVQAFVDGLEEILIVEEKREFIEYQLKQQIFNWDEKRRPVVVGKYDENKNRLLPLHNDHSVGMVARIIAQRIERFHKTDRIHAALKFYAEYEENEKGYVPASLRRPYYCSGCPHNTSTKVPDGSFAMVGIGCHYMVQWMDRNSALCTQMGGEGVPWIGSSPFSDTKHIFANLGDGTYFHSGSLAIRAAVAAKVNITYKILYNDAVAMTGGQQVDGELPVWRVAQQVMAEGVNKCWIVTENLEAYKDRSKVPGEVKILHRDWLAKVMDECRNTEGTTIIIYDQTCAAEKRRRRKRGQYPDPAKRVVINKDVCEACGDCSVQSNCVSVQPIETELGRKRTINQSSCNKDFSCLKGFCPSFVTIEGGHLRKTEAAKVDDAFAGIPMPNVPEMKGPYNVLVPGVGGTGVLTVGALLGMAAHLEGKYSAILDSTGLAQKGGEVVSYVRLSDNLDDLHNGHITAGGTDLLIACDIVSSVGRAAHETLNPDRTNAVVNIDNTPVAAFVLNNKIDFKNEDLQKDLTAATKAQYFVDATSAVGNLLGDEMGTNIFMMGYAWQKGLLPLSEESIMKAIEMNGVSIEDNKEAFMYGRLAAHDHVKMEAIIAANKGPDLTGPISVTLNEVIAKRIGMLKQYQNNAYAMRYKAMVERFAQYPNLQDAVARNYFKLMAYKDEYEVARLYTNGDFIKTVRAQFDGDYKMKFNLAPPIFETEDPATGRPKKRQFGPWMLPALSILKHFKFLRGSAFDPFGRLKDRVEERALIREYEDLMDDALAYYAPESAALCEELLRTPDDIRGYGPVKAGNIGKARQKQRRLLDQITGQKANMLKAA